ncbi:siderophore iron transporter mirb [Colletotrichum truncatum]|uniref:Siderophore iron transporter mirb n=1 Tax=Colletotrichum truncatum TaxID=5467 RepID=A0ACC3ZGC1_COLTU|nr:siderophore iron transporter mirb [Colletotrichum truncatum]KAF6784626.1 siderophore iron transporter mirb [Colletotrichum truncatum]
MANYPVPTQSDDEVKETAGAVITNLGFDSHSAQDDDTTIDKEAQAGVQGVEAITSVWSQTSIIFSVAFVWIVYFVMLMQQGTTGALTPYITSAFQLHSLTPTVTVLSSVIGGVCNLTVAKILDVFGRPHGYAAALFIATIGLIMMAATTSVEMYAAAQIFWTVGTNGLLYTVGIFVADISSLRNRALMSALASSPNIITIWLGGPIAEAFLKGPGWQWCLGLFTIMVPVMCLPLFGLLIFNYHKAKSQGIVFKEKETRLFTQSLVYYFREFDAVGLILVSAGLAMFLSPFNLYALQPLGWKSPLIICLLVFGILLMILFVIWERFFAPVTFIPYDLLLDRNVVGGCVLGAVLFISYFCWFSLFGSFLQVVNDLSVTNASYVVQIYGLGGSLFAFVAGLVIRYTGRFKPITLYVAMPIYTLFMGLLIYFRDPDMSIGYIIICQIFLSASSGILMQTPQLSAMAVSKHQHVAVMVALVSMFSSIGGAIGSTVSGAIWQAVFPVKLAEYLPVEEQPNLLTIYSMIETQLSYPVGTPTRAAIQRAYGDAQAMMLAAGTAIWAIAFVAVAFWRDIDVRTIKQVKGHII